MILRKITLFFLIFFLLFFLATKKIDASCQHGTCFRDWSEECTVNGRTGTRYCRINNCCKKSDGRCEWPQSRDECPNGSATCDPCRIPNEPTATPYPHCDLKYPTRYGYCATDGDGIGYGSHCNPRCHIGSFYYNQRQTNMDCGFVECTCNNSTWCCRPIADATPNPTSPPSNEPQPTTPPHPTPTNTPTPTMTPTPSPTPTNTPTPTPTYIPLTLPTHGPGQTNPLNIIRPAQAWYCLKSDYYNGSITPGGKSDHRLLLTGEGFTAGVKVYIVGCIATTGNINKCTTGKSDLDQTLMIEKAAGHRFIVDGENPITIANDGKLTKVVYSHSQESTIHSFYGVFILGSGESGTARSITYSTFTTRQDTTKCTAVRWDPYGRVFDSQSLEPLPNVKVLLLNEKKETVSLPGLINPLQTNKAGIFNFLVEEGGYYLQVTPPKGYQFTKKPNLNPDYYLAYSNIYKPDDLIIEEAGKPEHRDVPLDPGNNQPYEAPVSSISFSILPVKNGKQTKIVGQVSHPLTIITLKQKNKVIGKTAADKMGFYEIVIDNKDIVIGQPITPHFVKYQFKKTTQTSKNKGFFERILDLILGPFRKKTRASDPTIGLPIEPLPFYLEGFLDPESLVNIKLSSNNQVYFQTKTDKNGYFFISPENLPNFSYYFEVIQSNYPPKIISLSEFIEKNKKYFEEQKINIYQEKNN